MVAPQKSETRVIEFRLEVELRRESSESSYGSLFQPAYIRLIRIVLAVSEREILNSDDDVRYDVSTVRSDGRSTSNK
jgi:hypothetical protein